MEDASVDVAVSDFVLEHVADPDAFFAEAARVLRPGGTICLRTPNAFSYVALCSRLIPNRHHASVVGRVQNGRKEEDVFPTYYRANSRRKIRKLLAKSGFEPCVYGYEGEPSYLSFSRIAYMMGVVHQKLAPAMLVAPFSGMRPLRQGITCSGTSARWSTSQVAES